MFYPPVVKIPALKTKVKTKLVGVALVQRSRNLKHSFKGYRIVISIIITVAMNKTLTTIIIVTIITQSE